MSGLAYSRYAFPFLLIVLLLSACERDYDNVDEHGYTNPFDQNNPQTHGDPYNLRAEATDSEVTLNWDKIPMVDGVDIYRSTTIDGDYVNIGTSVSGEYVDDDIQSGTIYYYQLQADKDSIMTPRSESVTVSVPYRIGPDGAEMVLIPAGEFQMGDLFGEGDNDELPVHTVYLDDFYIDKYEVTNLQYAAFLNSYGRHVDDSGNLLLDIDDTDCLIEQSGGSYVARSGYEDHPVIELGWYGARVYAEFYGKRLPTEAEWEKAARGGLTGKKYPWGDSISHDDANYSGTGGKDRWPGTSPVGSFGANSYGLYDMAGNAWEWCSDWYASGYYPNSPRTNPTGPSSGYYRVLRGGSWYDDNESNLRCASRYALGPTRVNRHVGFRFAE